MSNDTTSDRMPRDLPRIRFRDFAKNEVRIVEYPDADPFELIEKVVTPHLGLPVGGTEDAQRNERYEAVMRERRRGESAANDLKPVSKRTRFNRYR